MATIPTVANSQQQNAKKSSKARDPVSPDETKGQRFVRLANRRVPKLLRMLSHVRNLANKSNYDYTDEQSAKIKNVVLTAVKSLTDAFSGVNGKDSGFSL